MSNNLELDAAKLKEDLAKAKSDIAKLIQEVDKLNRANIKNVLIHPSEKVRSTDDYFFHGEGHFID